MDRFWLALVLVIALSGCTDAAPPEDEATYRQPTVTVDGQEFVVDDEPEGEPGQATTSLSGFVLAQDGAPVTGAAVTILQLNRTTLTGADGAYAFANVPQGRFVLEARADGFLSTRLSTSPGDDAVFLLAYDRAARPPLTVQFDGIVQCALEVLIITPSCDTAATFAGAPATFEADNVFLNVVEPGWATLVVDVVFDDDAHPTLDGLRLTLRGTQDGDALLDYEEYGKFFTRDGPTFTIIPGGEYLEGDRPVPLDAAAFELETFPNGMLWHPGGAGVLGVGASVDVEFTLFVTTFYGESAPEGWSFLNV